MRQKHDRDLTLIVFDNGAFGTGFDIDALHAGLSVTQTYPFVLNRITSNQTTLSASATSSIDAFEDSTTFRCGSYLCSKEKINVDYVSRVNMTGEYSFSSGEVYGTNHFRRLYLALLSNSVCYVSGTGYYLSHNSEPTSSNVVPYVQVPYDPGASGEFSMSLDVSGLTGEYYLSAMMLLKACDVTGTIRINKLWLE